MATTAEPWLVVDSSERICRHRWIRIRYSSSLMDEPVRPLIRFTTLTGEVFVEPMNGAILGSAEWLGHIPANTKEIAISPSRRPGPFNFRIESISSVSALKLLFQGLFQSWLWSYWTVRCLVVGSNREACQALKSATEGTRFEEYGNWRRRNARRPDHLGFDVPRHNADGGVQFAVLIEAGEEPAAVQRTLESLDSQSYRHFIVRLTSAGGATGATQDDKLPGANGPIQIFANAEWKTLRNSLTPSDWVVAMKAGDKLQPYAFALLAETLAAPNSFDAIYTDEDCISPDGAFHSPSLKPDWSPIYQAQAQYVDRALFMRANAISEDACLAGLTSTQRMLHTLQATSPEKIHHLRRILYSSQRPAPAEPTAPTIKAAGIPNTPNEVRWPSVSVIIPTKDRESLLAACIESILEHTDYPDFNIVIVDNGSTSPEAVALLTRLQADKTINVVRSPGPFNYSKLCNFGASASSAQILVFLNNDTEVREGSEWLKSLARWALLPEVGAVGAKLFFANGRVQHAGVILGMSGIAGHAYLHQSDTATQGQWSDTTHEISAVTGACLAVDRRKFDEIGGFDERLAVDLNDIDLCLRLSEQGWSNVWTPAARLIHHESASRGIAKNYFEAYRREIAHFNERWAQSVRDDPYFHPGLSLYAHDIRLA